MPPIQPRLTSETVSVSEQPGANLNERWLAACRALGEIPGKTNLALDFDDDFITDTLVCKIPGKTGNAALFNNVRVYGTNGGSLGTRIWWANDGGNYDNKPMFEIVGGYRSKYERFSFNQRRYFQTTDTGAPANSVAVFYRSALEEDVNGSRQNQIKQIRVDNGWRGIVTGTYFGDDITGLELNACGCSCQEGFVFIGANITAQMQNCQYGCWSESNGIGVNVIGKTATYFTDGTRDDKEYYTDQYGTTYPYTRYTGSQWKLRIQDDAGETAWKNGADNPLFDANTAHTIGGSPDVSIIGLMPFNFHNGPGPHSAIVCETSMIDVDYIRCEMAHGRFLETRPLIPLAKGPNAPAMVYSNQSNSPTEIKIRRMRSPNNTNFPPLEIAANGALHVGPPIYLGDISTRRFDGMPAEEFSDNRIIQYEGTVRSPDQAGLIVDPTPGT